MDTHSVRMTAEDTATMRGWSEQKYAAYAQGSADEAGAEGGWDVIVITAADAGQQAAYEAQVAAELAQGNLPARPQWLVVADKPGAKIGPGGSTLFVLSVLQAKLGDALDAMRMMDHTAAKETSSLTLLKKQQKLRQQQHLCEFHLSLSSRGFNHVLFLFEFCFEAACSCPYYVSDFRFVLICV